MFRLRPWWGWRREPPQCPVDDAPHTTCTSPDYGGALTVHVRPPRTLAATLRLAPPPPVVATVTEVTTATYRRPTTKRKGSR